MNDYIKREDALAICEKEYKERLKMLDYIGDTVACNIGNAVINLPAADVVELKHGQWQLDEDASCGHIEYLYTCSACRNCTARGEAEKTRYCPSCGAKMGLED